MKVHHRPQTFEGGQGRRQMYRRTETAEQYREVKPQLEFLDALVYSQFTT